MTSETETMERLANLTAMITKTHEEIATGMMIDMSEIQDRVQALCEEIQANPPDDPASVEAAINQMIDHFNSLSKELTAQHKLVGGEFIRKAALSAYKTPKDDR